MQDWLFHIGVFILAFDFLLVLPLAIYIRQLPRSTVIQLAGLLHDWLQNGKDVSQDIHKLLD